MLILPLDDPHILVPYVLDISVSDFLPPAVGGLPCLGLTKDESKNECQKDDPDLKLQECE